MDANTEHEELVEIEVPISFVARVDVRPGDTAWRDALAASARDEVARIVQQLEGSMPRVVV